MLPESVHETLRRAVDLDAAETLDPDERGLVLATAGELGLSLDAVAGALDTTASVATATAHVPAPVDHVAAHTGAWLIRTGFRHVAGAGELEIWQPDPKARFKDLRQLSDLRSIECHYREEGGQTVVTLVGVRPRNVRLRRKLWIAFGIVSGAVSLAGICAGGMALVYQAIMALGVVNGIALAVTRTRALRTSDSHRLQEALAQVRTRATIGALRHPAPGPK